MKIKIGIVQRLHTQLRYTLQVYENDEKVFGWSDIRPENTKNWLEKNKTQIESAEFWANASPVPPEALEVVSDMKTILGEERCL